MSITQITSIIGLEEYPLIARYSIMGESEEMISMAYGPDVSAAKLNIAGYGTVYLLPIYTTLLFALMKRQLFSPILFVGHVILSFVFIFATQFTIGLLLYTVTVIALLITDIDTKKMIATAVFTLLLLICFSGFFSQLFADIASVVESDTLSGRFLEISNFFAGKSIEGTDLSTRFNHYSDSFLVFLKNILWGGKLVGERGGGHSAILDYLSQGGIWALGIMIFFFKTLYRKLFYPFSDDTYIRYIRISFVFFFVSAFFNPMFYLGTMSNFIFVISGFCAILFKNNPESNCANSKDIIQKVSGG